jgi:predicted amino acid racemase
MRDRATLTVDLGAIADNAHDVVAALPGIAVVGVTKCSRGSPELARTMLTGGAVAIGESRHENAERLRAAGIEAPLWLLRGTVPERAGETVALFDLSLNSELETVKALDAAAKAAGKRHQVIVMVELGDLREGIMPAELPAFADAVERLAGVELAGIGVNLTCYGAIMPDEDNLGRLAELAAQTERQLGRPLRYVSGGNSGSLDLAFSGRMPRAINTLRLGETILHGVDTLTREQVLDLRLDAFTVEAPVIECLVKPSLPSGTGAQDAYGRRPTFADRGERRRAICALGRQDCQVEGLTPLDPRVEVLGASSDHLILDVEAVQPPPVVGEALAFRPTYPATLELFTSPYVHKVFTPPA